MVDVVTVLLGKQILIDTMLSGSRDDDSAILVLAEPLLEHATTEVISLPFHHLADGIAELHILDASLPRRLGKPGCPEYSAWSAAQSSHCPV